jgi:DNA-binding GntR family transcriptional regulator
VGLAGNHQLNLAIAPILVQLQRPMAANLRRETAALGSEAGIRRHEELLKALQTDDLDGVLHALEQHGERQYIGGSVADTVSATW